MLVRRRPDRAPGRFGLQRGGSAQAEAGQAPQGGKNDFVDAERAARTAIAGDGASIPKSRDGWAETARPALRAREILVRTQMQVANAVKALLNTAPARLRRPAARRSGIVSTGAETVGPTVRCTASS